MDPKAHIEEIDIQKYWLVLKRRWLAAGAVFAAVMGLTAYATVNQTPLYQASGKLLFKSDRTSTLVGIGSSGELKPIDTDSNPLDTQVEIIQSVPIAEKTIEDLQRKGESIGFSDPDILIARLSVKGISGTDVLQIAYADDKPERAATIVNQLMETYIRENIQTNRAEAASAREFIKAQLPEVEKAVSQAEADLRDFKERNRVVVLEQEASAAVSSIASLDDSITKAEADLAEVTARAGELRSQLDMGTAAAIDVSSLSQSPGIQEALQKLQDVQSQLAVERTRYQPTHPAVVRLERQEASLNALLQQRVNETLQRSQDVPVGDLQAGELKQSLISDYVQTEIRRLSLIRRIDLLNTAQATYEDRASVLPGLEKTQRELERRLLAAQSTYETLLTKLQEVQVTENQNIGNARVIQNAAIPETPFAPNTQLMMITGGVAGIMLGIAMAFLLDMIDRSVKTIKEGKELLGYTLLGVIPSFGKSGKLGFISRDVDQTSPRIVARDFPQSPVKEAYQMLQANLKFLSSDHEIKTIVVTSSVAQEGKSEVSANLAVALAQVGRKVLLVDADLRNPSQHHAWDLTNAEGLSNVIVGHTTFSKAVREVAPNLHVLPAGVIPPNPAPLLDSKRMAALVKDLASVYYDFVVIDTPPVSGAADALILGRMTDGILYVMRPGVIDSASATAAKEALKQSGQKVLGLVANGVDINNEPDSYFHYTRDYPSRRHPEVREAQEAELNNTLQF